MESTSKTESSVAATFDIRMEGENFIIENIKYLNEFEYGFAQGFSKSALKSIEGGEIITSFIYDLETFDIPEPNSKQNNSGINISLHQNQTVNVNVIWESIRDELKGSQLKEIEEIINDDGEPQSKKDRLFDKVKSFGTDVATNIIAGILTNPAIYSG